MLLLTQEESVAHRLIMSVSLTIAMAVARSSDVNVLTSVVIERPREALGEGRESCR